MELVEQTHSWIENIQHCVHFDSWNQFDQMGIGLRTTWANLVLLTWGCKQEKNGFILQLVYMNLYHTKQTKEILPAFNNHRFELKAVEIGFKESDVPSIREWLTEQNPDLWKMKFLTNKKVSPSHET
jgi:hypothetical protein